MSRFVSSSFLSIALAASAGATAVSTLAVSGEAFAQANTTGPSQVVVMGLRAINGDDDIAAVVTSAIRRAVEAKDLPVASSSPSLDQSMALFSCDDSLPVDCLSKISDDLHSPRVVYGLVRREGRGRQAPLVVEVRLYVRRENASSDVATFTVSRDDARRGDRLAPSAEALVNTLFPRTGVSIETGRVLIGGTNTSGGGTVIRPRDDHNNNGNHDVTPVTPAAGPSGKRIAGFVMLGTGGAVLVAGVAMGGAWLGFNGSLNPTGTPTGDAAVWNNYQPFGFPRSGDSKDNSSASEICRAASLGASNSQNTGYSAQDIATVNRICNDGGMLQLGQWGFIGLGVAIATVGIILVATDAPAAPPPPRATGMTPAQASRAASAVQFGLTPALSPTFTGANLQIAF